LCERIDLLGWFDIEVLDRRYLQRKLEIIYPSIDTQIPRYITLSHKTPPRPITMISGSFLPVDQISISDFLDFVFCLSHAIKPQIQDSVKLGFQAAANITFLFSA
jgi:hypothetical protein